MTEKKEKVEHFVGLYVLFVVLRVISFQWGLSLESTMKNKQTTNNNLRKDSTNNNLKKDSYRKLFKREKFWL